MAGADLIVRIDGDPSGFDRAAKSAASSASVFERELNKLEQQQQKVHQAMTQVGAALVGMGAGMLLGVGMAVKAAVDWESAWAGVRKTVDGSDAEMASLEKELRNLAKTLPATHTEIAAVAEAAGQLGVKREDITAFTKTMIDLGETTNLTADEAATSIAQLANIMGTASGDVDNLGAALVALGNDGASTERDIIQMAQRIAGAGKTIGLAESDVLGFANAMSSMGIEAEAGGTAISTVMLSISKAVDKGGDDLTKFARVAGMTSEEFTTAFRTKPAAAIQAFVEGLGRIQAEGGNTTAALDDLGFGGIRVSDTLRRLSSNTDLLNDSLMLGATAWEENSALVEEASKRYDTTAAKVQVAKNNLNDAAITIGESLIPALSGAADAVVGLVEWFDKLPSGVKGAIGPLTLVGGGLLTLAGTALILIPRVVELKKAMDLLAVSSPRVASGLTAVGKAAGAAAAIYTLALAFSTLAERNREAVSGIEKTTAALLKLDQASNIESIDQLFQGFSGASGEVNNFASAVERIVRSDWEDKIVDFGDGLFGIENEADRAREQIENLGQSLAFLVESGEGDRAAEQFNMLAGALEGTGISADELMGLMPAYGEALAGVGNESELTAGKSTSLTDAFASTEGSIAGVALTAEEAADAISALSAELDAILGRAFSVEEATDAYASSLHALTAAAKDNGKATDDNTEGALANREALRKSTEAAFNVIDAMQKQGATSEQLTNKTAELKQSLYNTAIQAGYSEAAARRYSDQLDNIPPIVNTVVNAATEAATSKILSVADHLRQLDGRVATVAVRYQQSGGTVGMPSRVGNIANADGNIIEAYASGGFSENHVAQFASGGVTRTWGEPETGGEAYIPLAPGKRDRSLAIWEETGRRLGAFTGGAMGPSITVNQYLSDVSDVRAAAAASTAKLRDAVLVNLGVTA